jgi:hypothetical protein
MLKKMIQWLSITVVAFLAQKKNMTLISNSKITHLSALAFLLIGIFLSGNSSVYAEDDTQTLSVSPTLFQMTATRDQVWKSEVRVINVNKYDITVYPQIVNFAPAGEAGRGDFIPIMSSETGGQTLAEWIDIAKDGIVIAPQTTAVVPFTVYVPGTAAPGGHYAAILIGTKPADPNAADSVVKTAQFVTALFFMRVAGEVTESGSIREFRTTKTLLQKPEANFEVRFQNTGNVHLQPQGDIEIFNMWNEERGTIPINHQTHFGNVLPNSIRKFEFAWKTEGSAFDIGRYRAVVTLGYGDDTKSFVTSSTYFWIVPYKEILIVLGSFVLFVWIFALAVKMYVRRMLLLSGISPQQLPVRMVASAKVTSRQNTVRVARYLTVSAPVRTSLQDVWQQLKQASNITSYIRVCTTLLRTHWLFFVTIIALLGASFGVAFLWSRAHTAPRPYEVTIGSSDSPITLSSESIYYDNLKSQSNVKKSVLVPEYSKVSIAIVNVSGELGKAAKLRLKLETDGYTVPSVTGDLARSDTATKIIYHPDNSEAAIALGKRLGGVLLSADSQAKNMELMIYVGKDQLPE